MGRVMYLMGTLYMQGILYLMNIILFDPHSNSFKRWALLFSDYRWGNKLHKDSKEWAEPKQWRKKKYS